MLCNNNLQKMTIYLWSFLRFAVVGFFLNGIEEGFQISGLCCFHSIISKLKLFNQRPQLTGRKGRAERTEGVLERWTYESVHNVLLVAFLGLRPRKTKLWKQWGQLLDGFWT